MGRTRKILGTGAAALAITLAGTPAHADTGDRTISFSDTDVRLATNQCAGSDGWFRPVGGAPGRPSGLYAFAGAGRGSCMARVRIVYVRTWSGPVYSTAYRYASAGTVNTTAVDSGFRCYWEFGVRRNNGTYYTRAMVYPSTPRPAGCPS
ncbi:MAG TPA: hypothetical protein VFV66_26105 [Nonomuraea sp.]|nr:hypothetical protein [Nonomuraea sp.]